MTLGRQYPFRAVPWDVIATRCHEMADRYDSFRHMAAIVDSVIAHDGAAKLLGYTSMHDVVLTTRPIAQPYYEVIRVCAPGSLREVTRGCVKIEHVGATRIESIERPVEEALALFWRFMIEKFDVHPDTSTR